MEWLINKLVGKTALYACAGMLAVIVVLSLGLAIQTSRHEKEVKAHAETSAKLTIAQADVKRSADATEDWKRTTGELEKKLAHANEENVRVKKEGDAAVLKAKREASAARGELKSFMELFGGKTKNCEQALVAMEVACPELSDY